MFDAINPGSGPVAKDFTLPISRHPGAESREPRAESREPSSCPSPGRAVPRLNSGSRRRPPESSPAALSRRGFSCCRFAFRRLAALAGGFRRSLPAAVLLALAALGMLAGTSSPSMAQSGFTVARDWELAPSAIPRGGQFRLLYVTSNARNAESSSGNDYNAFVWALAGITGTNRHSAMTTDQARKSYGVWCTSSFDSNAITDTTGTGVPIYWLNGNKVADNYADFHDGGWDDEANPRDESGTLVTTNVDRIWTGCNHNGTAKSGATLGHSGARAAFGALNHSSHGPLSNSGAAADTALQGRLYGITRIYTVEQARIASVAIASTPRNTTRGYFVGEEIRVRIRYNEPVAVTRANDPPSVWLKVGNEVRRAWYASGSGTADLVFAYTVQSGDVDTNGVSLCSDTSLHGTCGRISLNGGTIEATADDTRAPVNYPEMSDQAAHGIGGPVVIGVAMQSAPASGDTYAAARDRHRPSDLHRSRQRDGDRPFVYLNVGGAVRKAVFTSGSGSANLDFAYTVAAADFDADGVKRLLEPPVRPRLAGGCSSTADRSSRASTRSVAGHPRPIPPKSRPVRPQGRRHAGDDRSGAGSDFETRRRSRDGDRAGRTGRCARPASTPGTKFRLLFVTNGQTRRDLDRHRRLQQLRAERGGGRSCRDPRVLSRFPGAREHRKRSMPATTPRTTGTGVPIYWLNSNEPGRRLFADLYDGSVGQREPAHQRERGTTTGSRHLGRCGREATDDGRKSTSTGCRRRFDRTRRQRGVQ